MNFRCITPPVGSTFYNSPRLVNGRSYAYLTAPGQAVDVPDFDQVILAANVLIPIAPSGPTSARPSTNPNTSPPYTAGAGFHFFDTTLSALIVFDGATWRNPATGSAV